jgi:tetratricopeptide (TPR) repeat protein
MKKHLLLFLFLLPLLSLGQSKDAYMKAGDACMVKEDPYSAIGHYQAALEYDDDAVIQFKLSSAYLKLSDYSNALFQSEKTRNNTTDTTLKIQAIYRSAELLKRNGRFDEAIELLNAKKDSLSIKIINELKQSKINAIDTADFYLQQLPENINSGNSEFSPAALGDSILFYSSHRFPAKEDNNTTYSKVLSSKIKNTIYESGITLPTSINNSDISNGNVSISPDGKVMIFTRCQYNDSNVLICDLYEVTIKNGKYNSPKKINLNVGGYTSTQPCITTHPTQGYQLYFSSNRNGGFGQNDIYTSYRNAEGKYSSAINLGKKVNTADNELTPFYNLNNDTLYFSSDKAGGLGGFDIYQVSLKDSNTTALPLKAPFNSGYNDLYYTASYGKEPNTYMVSNRPPAGKLNASACCFDIFKIKKADIDSNKIKKKEEEELSLIKLNKGLGDDRFLFDDSLSYEKINSLLRELLPLSLYFDNDYPDPKTRKETTSTRYQQLVSDYLDRLGEYSQVQSDSAKREGITKFFNDSVYGNFQRLEIVCAGIKKALSNEQDIVIKLKVEGSASSLATDAYNVILSSRRISSIFNYWGEWNDGFIKNAIQNGQIIINKNPRGEQQAAGKVSDDANNQVLSVFSIEAASERKIVITDLSIEKKNEVK